MKLKINREFAMNMWGDSYGTATSAKDLFGYRMNKANYGQAGEGGWNIHHIIPKAKGGKDSLNNLMLVSMKAHNQIGDKTTFAIDGKYYQATWSKKRQKYEYVEIEYV